MNSEAVEWLESLDFSERSKHFTPVVASAGVLFTVKHDHEPSGYIRYCAMCNYGNNLVVIGE